ncbi:MAG: hypothetical protein VYA30_15870, partial [Myxococcota bacterium]|nr:hypothetical protein [Myxococcota bacterium]
VRRACLQTHGLNKTENRLSIVDLKDVVYTARPMMRMTYINLFVTVFALGCATEQPAGEIAESGDVWAEFGLPKKGDDPGCSVESKLCWQIKDINAFKALMGAEDRLLMALGDPLDQMRTIEGALIQLRDKLVSTQLSNLEQLMGDAARVAQSASSDAVLVWLDSLRRDVVNDLYDGYFTAHAVGLGSLARNDAKYDVYGRDGHEASQAGLTSGMLDSLSELKNTGVVGQAYALLMLNTGVLDEAYVVNDGQFPSERPIELQAQELIDRARWASIRLNTLTNLESLIPFVGLGISIPHNMIANFRIRARLVFQLVSLYGLDIRQGSNLLLATQVMLSSMGIIETRLLMAAAMAIPVVTAIAMNITGSVAPQAVFRRVLMNGLSTVLSRLGRLGEQVLARAAARAGAQAVGRQVLGYATLGVSIIADIALATAATSRIGTHADALARPWASMALQYGSDLFSDMGQGGRCMFQLFGQAARADGRLSPDELVYIAGQLTRQNYRAGRWVMADGIQSDRWVAALSDDSLADCVIANLVPRSVSDRRNVLALVAVLLAIDGVFSPEEMSHLDALVDALDGDRLFGDGIGIREDDLEAIIVHIESVFSSRPPLIEIFGLELIGSLHGSDFVLGLEQVTPSQIDRVRCGFTQNCFDQ